MHVKRILFIHQSAEMYGSDKVILWLVIGLKARGFSVVVLLPTEGPLQSALQAEGIETHIGEVTKLNREILSPTGLLKLPIKLAASMRDIKRVVNGRKIDLIYSNTVAVLGGAFYAWCSGVPHLWHVHELLKSPFVVRKGFPLIVHLLADQAVCNSTMTALWLSDEQPALKIRLHTIWNGLGLRPEVDYISAAATRARLQINDGELLVALVGRINRWKGQELLIEAATELFNRGVKHVHYAIVGGVAPGQEHLVDALKLRISKSPAAARLHLMEFTDDVWTVWDACDIAVVPSTEPEPFGMVAIEAMASNKPVVVAAHGGLLDIVEDGVSGLHFKPNDPVDFANQLERLITNSALRQQLAQSGRMRQAQLFSLDTQIDRTLRLVNTMTSEKTTAHD